MSIKWAETTAINSKSYRCGHCRNNVASSSGYYSSSAPEGSQLFIYICPHCGKPTTFHGAWRMPDVAPGNDVEDVPKDVAELYLEARNCVSISAYTSAVLSCRKLLMNIAVSQGADEGRRFIEYVDFLSAEGFVPPNGKGWVNHIRKRGNEATHEIVSMSRENAEELISFAEMLLKFIYEFPARIPASPSEGVL